MALKDWIKLYAPVGQIPYGSEAGRDLIKWIGLDKSVLNAYGVSAVDGALHDDVQTYPIDSSTCLLCSRFGRWRGVRGCPLCPLALVRDGYPCDVFWYGQELGEFQCSPYHAWTKHGDNVPMTHWLALAVLYQNKLKAGHLSVLAGLSSTELLEALHHVFDSSNADCGATSSGFACTRPREHTGPHVALGLFPDFVFLWRDE